MNSEIQISLEIASITEEGFTPVRIDCVPGKDAKNHMKVSTQILTEVDSKNHLIKIHSAVKYQVQDVIVLSLAICVAYRVSPFNELISVDREKKQISFSADFIPTLLSTTYDTLRGVFYEKTKGTIMSDFSVPLSSPSMLASFNRFKVVGD